MDIAEKIREVCKTAGLTQQQFADHYDIPLRTLETWLGGTRTPLAYVVTLLLRCLAIDFPTAEQQQEPKPAVPEPEPVSVPEPMPAPKKPTYTFHTSWGKRLTPEQTVKVEQKIADGKTEWVADDENDPTRKTYICKDDGVTFEMRPVKEV